MAIRRSIGIGPPQDYGPGRADHRASLAMTWEDRVLVSSTRSSFLSLPATNAKLCARERQRRSNPRLCAHCTLEASSVVCLKPQLARLVALERIFGVARVVAQRWFPAAQLRITPSETESVSSHRKFTITISKGQRGNTSAHHSPVPLEKLPDKLLRPIARYRRVRELQVHGPTFLRCKQPLYLAFGTRIVCRIGNG